MLIPVIVHAIRVTRFPEKIKCKPLYLWKFLIFSVCQQLVQTPEKSANVSCSGNAVISHYSCYSCNTFSGKNQVQTPYPWKILIFSACRQLVQTPEKSANVSCSGNAVISHYSCYSCNMFPGKIKCKPLYLWKFLIFPACRQPVQTPEISDNVSCSGNAVISHCSCYSCNTFSWKNQVQTSVSMKISHFFCLPAACTNAWKICQCFLFRQCCYQSLFMRFV